MYKHTHMDIEKAFYRFLLGLTAGFLLGNHFLPILVKTSSCFMRFPAALSEGIKSTTSEEPFVTNGESTGLVYIGMMSMDNKMDSRVEAAMNTWMKNLNSLVKVEVFANNNGSFDNVKKFRHVRLQNGVRVLQLPGVSDHVYPPQKKSFSMVKFMHDEYLHRYDWFVRLDDDAYADTNELVALLSRLNSSKPIYLGHAGFGKHNDDYIDVSKGENYCMGGTGMVFSKGLMQIFAPGLKECLQNLLTSHEDIELGRCVTKMSGVKCTTSWETQKLFFQNFKNGTYAHNMLDPAETNIKNGVLFHANKDPRYQHNFHVKLLKTKLKKLKARVIQLEKEIRRDYNFDRERYDWASNSHSHLRWDAIVQVLAYKSNDRDMKKRMHGNLMKRLLDNTNLFVKMYRQSNHKSSRNLKYASLESSYHVVNPLLSTDFVSKIKFAFRKNTRSWQKKETRYSHQRQYFSNYLHFVREPNEINLERLNNVIQQKLNQEFSSNDRLPESTSGNIPINFLTALSGRIQNTKRFLNNFEETFLKAGANVNLIVVYFLPSRIDDVNELNQSISVQNTANSTTSSDEQFILDYMTSLQSKYRHQTIKLVLMPVGDQFSRGIGLQEASKHVNNENDIIFFCDVDLVFAPDLLDRIRRNTVQGKRVYYPVFFSQYDPDVVYVEREKPKSHFDFDELDGFWRIFSYGMFSIYKSDFNKTNGFNINIQGWGLEDVQMMESVLNTKLDIFQCHDPALVHIFHEKYCDPQTTKLQYTDCIKSRFIHYGPKTLMYYLLKASKIGKDILESDKTM